MNITGWTLVAAPCLALAAFNSPLRNAWQSPWQDSDAKAPVANTPADLDDASSWREQLRSDDLSARESAFEALIDRASESEAARARLQEWSNDRDQLEFAWTCRLALRELDARSKSFGAWHSFDDPFEALRQHMFSGGLGNDAFGGLMLSDPFGGGFNAHGGAFDSFQNVPQGSGMQSQSESFSLEMGPDGVKARVKTKVDGEDHEEEFSAKTLDELLLAHPELSKHIQSGNSARVGGLGLRFGLPGFDFDHRLSGPMRTDVLGVYIATAASNDAAGSDGLRIERVQPGSLAEKLGLEPGQVLSSLNGRSLKTRDDISSALRERKPDEAVVVEVRGQDGALSTKTWEPSKNSRGKAHPLPALPKSRKI